MASALEAAAPDFACDALVETTNGQVLPFDRDGRDACALYGTELAIGPSGRNNTTRINYTSSTPPNATETCNQFRYDTSVFTSTIVTEVRS